MQKKLLFLLLAVIFCGFGMEAKDKIKTTEFCPFLKFEGLVEKEKGTKAKIPTGNGVLYIPVLNARDEKVVEIKGDFSANHISNAVITLFSSGVSQYEVFSGDLTYQYQYDKQNKDFNLELAFDEGALCLYYAQHNTFGNIFGYEFKRKIPIPNDLNIRLAFSNIDHGSKMQVVYSPTKLQIKNNEMPEVFPSTFSKHIAQNIWTLDLGFSRGLALPNNYSWIKTELKNGMTVLPDKDGIKITGKNQTGYYGSKFRLPLKDGGFLEYLKDSYLRLIYPNGDIYEGSFASVPFKYKDSNEGVEGFDVKDEVVYGWGSKTQGDCRLYSTIIESSSTDYKIGTGKYKHSTGLTEIYKRGVADKGFDLSQPRIVELKKPGTLLSNISPDNLKFVTNLTIVGYLDDNDLDVITKICKNLSRLDLSLAYTQLSEGTSRERAAEAAALGAIFSQMGVIADNEYADFNMSTTDYQNVKAFSKLVEQATSKVKNSDKNCIIPTSALREMDNLEEVILPIWCSKIEDRAFYKCPSLKTVVLPDHLKSIGQGAFAYCKSLKNINFPATLSYIHSGYRGPYNDALKISAFGYCTSLKDVDLSKCTWSDDEFDGVFQGCNLSTLKLPKGITYFASYAKIIYANKGITGFYASKGDTVYFKDTTPPYYKDGYYALEGCTLYVPKGSMTAYYSKYGESNNSSVKI